MNLVPEVPRRDDVVRHEQSSNPSDALASITERLMHAGLGELIKVDLKDAEGRALRIECCYNCKTGLCRIEDQSSDFEFEIERLGGERTGLDAWAEVAAPVRVYVSDRGYFDVPERDIFKRTLFLPSPFSGVRQLEARLASAKPHESIEITCDDGSTAADYTATITPYPEYGTYRWQHVEGESLAVYLGADMNLYLLKGRENLRPGTRIFLNETGGEFVLPAFGSDREQAILRDEFREFEASKLASEPLALGQRTQAYNCHDQLDFRKTPFGSVALLTTIGDASGYSDNEDSYSVALTDPFRDGELEAESEPSMFLTGIDGLGSGYETARAVELFGRHLTGGLCAGSSFEQAVYEGIKHVQREFRWALAWNSLKFCKPRFERKMETGLVYAASEVFRNRVLHRHVGDARTVHLRGEEVVYESKDHTCVAEALAEGFDKYEVHLRPSTFEVSDKPLNNYEVWGTIRVIAGRLHLAAATSESCELKRGDRIVIFSDGVSDNILNEKVIEIAKLYSDPCEAAQAIRWYVERLISCERYCRWYPTKPDNILVIVYDHDPDDSMLVQRHRG